MPVEPSPRVPVGLTDNRSAATRFGECLTVNCWLSSCLGHPTPAATGAGGSDQAAALNQAMASERRPMRSHCQTPVHSRCSPTPTGSTYLTRWGIAPSPPGRPAPVLSASMPGKIQSAILVGPATSLMGGIGLDGGLGFFDVFAMGVSHLPRPTQLTSDGGHVSARLAFTNPFPNGMKTAPGEISGGRFI